MRLAMIPARGGSKRIKNKNIIDFMGKPMISYPLEAAAQSKLFDHIHVSTDSAEVRGVVENLGFPVEFMRPADLADDKTPILPVVQWVLKKYGELGKNFKSVTLIFPCTPLIEASDLIRADGVFQSKGGRRPLMAVAPFPVPVEWAYRRAEDGSLTPVNPGAYAVRSQDLGKGYYDSGAFYFYSTEHILGQHPVTDKDYVSVLLPRTKAVDIDDEDDLQLAKALFSAQRQLA